MSYSNVVVAMAWHGFACTKYRFDPNTGNAPMYLFNLKCPFLIILRHR